MKTQGTQTVKDEEMAKIDETAKAPDEDPAHHIDSPLEKGFVEVSADLADSESEGRWSRGDPITKPQYLDSHCWIDVVTACKNVFSLYEQSTHVTWEHLCQDVCGRHGEGLSDYFTDKRQAVFEIVATNVLVEARKLQESQPQGESPTEAH
jgi:hypothetical protein